MLRFFALILIIGGFAASIVWPNIVLRNSGHENVRKTVFERQNGGVANGWRAASIELSPADNPVRIVVDAVFLSGNKKIANTTALQVSIKLVETVVFEGEFELFLPGGGINPELPQVSSLALPDFEVDEAGQYNVLVNSVESTDMNFKSIGISVRTNVEIPDERYVKPGFAALGLGVVLWLFTTGRRTKSARNRREQKSRKWGRS